MIDVFKRATSPRKKWRGSLYSSIDGQKQKIAGRCHRSLAAASFPFTLLPIPVSLRMFQSTGRPGAPPAYVRPILSSIPFYSCPPSFNIPSTCCSGTRARSSGQRVALIRGTWYDTRRPCRQIPFSAPSWLTVIRNLALKAAFPGLGWPASALYRHDMYFSAASVPP